VSLIPVKANEAANGVWQMLPAAGVPLASFLADSSVLHAARYVNG
jgi:hypothetical protein